MNHTLFNSGPQAGGIRFWLRRALVAAIAGWAISTDSAAQPAVETPTATSRKAATADAVAAFSAGNPQAALARVQREVSRGAGAPHEDLQVARALLPVAFALRDARNGSRAAEASELALTKLDHAETRMSARDAASAYNLVGQIHEWRGQPGPALIAFRRALELDGTLRRARERVAHLEAEKQALDGRVAANALLQSRTQTKR
jgi:tetratricopeptide (TPR) repeat protein